jgi:hypothetical protein
VGTLIDLYQKYCPYKVYNQIQELDFKFDIDRLRKELFDFINKNQFGFDPVSLKLPPGQSIYTSKDEMLETGGIDAINYLKDVCTPSNTRHNNEYLDWHPDLKNSYTKLLAVEIEHLCGLHIGRVRLGWLQPGKGYPIHCDLEPMRLHIPLFTNNLAYIIHKDKLYNMKYGKLYHLITTDLHTAWNFGNLPRLHLIFSTYADELLDEEINKLTQKKITAKNFFEIIENQGIDKYSLLELLKIKESDQKPTPADKLQMLREIKAIMEIISEKEV